MPRFHFNVFDGRDALDLTGSELPDLASAKREAVRYSGALLSEAPDNLWGGRPWRMIVTDHHGASLFVLLFLGLDTASTPGSPPKPSND